MGVISVTMIPATRIVQWGFNIHTTFILFNVLIFGLSLGRSGAKIVQQSQRLDGNVKSINFLCQINDFQLVHSDNWTNHWRTCNSINRLHRLHSLTNNLTKTLTIDNYKTSTFFSRMRSVIRNHKTTRQGHQISLRRFFFDFLLDFSKWYFDELDITTKLGSTYGSNLEPLFSAPGLV